MFQRYSIYGNCVDNVGNDFRLKKIAYKKKLRNRYYAQFHRVRFCFDKKENKCRDFLE